MIFVNNSQNIQELTKLFHQLCDMIDMINASFIFPLNFIFFNFFISNILSCFNIFWEYKKESDLLYVIANEGSYFVFNYCIQSLCVHASCTLTNEATETSTIVAKITNNQSFDKSSRKLLKSFLTQHQSRNFKLQTCFFTLNWKLILSVSFSSI
jgi:7tm Chemosensory receptor